MPFDLVIQFLSIYSTKIFSPVHKYAFSILCYIAYNYETLESLIPYGRTVMLNKLWLNPHYIISCRHWKGWGTSLWHCKSSKLYYMKRASYRTVHIIQSHLRENYFYVYIHLCIRMDREQLGRLYSDYWLSQLWERSVIDGGGNSAVLEHFFLAIFFF